MGVAVLGTWLWRNLDKPEVPPLEPGLVAAAQTYHIDLTPTRKASCCASPSPMLPRASLPHDSKDARLAALIDKSLDMDRFDAACVAAVLCSIRTSAKASSCISPAAPPGTAPPCPGGLCRQGHEGSRRPDRRPLPAQRPLARMSPALSRGGCFS